MSLSEYRNPTSAREVRKFFEYLCAMNWTCWGAQAYRQPASVGWGKTRAQRAPHPNTPISKLQPVDWNRRYTHSADLSGTRNIAVGLTARSSRLIRPTGLVFIFLRGALLVIIGQVFWLTIPLRLKPRANTRHP